MCENLGEGRARGRSRVGGAGRSTPSTPSRPFDIAIHGGGNVVLKISQICSLLRRPHSLQFIQQVAAPGTSKYHGDNRDLSAGLSVSARVNAFVG